MAKRRRTSNGSYTRTPFSGREFSTGGVLTTIKGWWAVHGHPPTYRDLAEVIGCGPHTLIPHIDKLESEGKIEYLRKPKSGVIWPAGLREKIKVAAREMM